MVWSRLNTFYRQDANGEYILDEKGNKIAVDTILYEGEYIDFVPNLGYGLGNWWKILPINSIIILVISL